MAKKDTNQVEDVNVNTNEEVTPVTTPNVAPEEAVNVQAANPNVDGESTTTPDVSEEKVEAKNKKLSKADAEFNRLVEDTIRGVHGTGRERMISLGDQYVKVQQEIHRRSLQ